MKDVLTNEHGHCCYCLCSEKDCAMIYNLYIKKEHRRKGNARGLVYTAITTIRETGYNEDIKIVAEPEEDSISKKDLVKFYKCLSLKVVDNTEGEV